MRDVRCCQVPTAAMETQYAAFHHPLHSNCYWCIAPKQVPKGCSSITMETTSPPLLLYCLLYCSELAFLFHGFPCEKRKEKSIHNYQSRNEEISNLCKISPPTPTQKQTMQQWCISISLLHCFHFWNCSVATTCIPVTSHVIILFANQLFQYSVWKFITGN